MDKVQKELSEAQMINAKVQSALDSKKESLKAEEKKKKSLIKQKDDVGICIIKLLKILFLKFLKQITITQIILCSISGIFFS